MKNKDANCLSDAIFENLLFVNVIVCGEPGIALFDTGAQKTVVSRKFLSRCNIVISNESVYAGNNNGQKLSLNTASLKTVKIADIVLTDAEVLVIDDDCFDMVDSQGNPFPADMLLGYEIIGNFKWTFTNSTKVLTVNFSDTVTVKPNLGYNVFPMIQVTSGTNTYLAGIDTGHTDTILKSNVNINGTEVTYIDDVITGIGSTKETHAPIISKCSLTFEDIIIELSNITLQDEIYGVSPQMDILLGMDFFKDVDWEMDFISGTLILKNK